MLIIIHVVVIVIREDDPICIKDESDSDFELQDVNLSCVTQNEYISASMLL